MAAVKKLIGENVFLGPVSKEYIPKLVRWMNDLEVVKYTCQASLMHTEEIEKQFLENAAKSQTHYYFGIFLNNGELIGGIGLTELSSVNRTAILGITIGEKKLWSKGYGTEAITLLLDYGFNVLNLNNIMLTVFEFNPRAIKAYEKSGFKAIGRRRESKFFLFKSSIIK